MKLSDLSKPAEHDRDACEACRPIDQLVRARTCRIFRWLDRRDEAFRNILIEDMANLEMEAWSNGAAFERELLDGKE